jgi:hypothetical protein
VASKICRVFDALDVKLVTIKLICLWLLVTIELHSILSGLKDSKNRIFVFFLLYTHMISIWSEVLRVACSQSNNSMSAIRVSRLKGYNNRLTWRLNPVQMLEPLV